jgi:hypothetical protein
MLSPPIMISSVLLLVIPALRSEMRLRLKTEDSVPECTNCGGRIIQNYDWVARWRPQTCVRFQAKEKDFSLFRSVQSPLGSTEPPIIQDIIFFLGNKAIEGQCLPPTYIRVKDKNVCVHTSRPPASRCIYRAQEVPVLL